MPASSIADSALILILHPHRPHSADDWIIPPPTVQHNHHLCSILAATLGGAELHNDIPEMAAAYLFHLTPNHAFLDGNKRIGLAACITFMHLNGIHVIAESGKAVELVLGVAKGEVERPAIAEFLRAHSSGARACPRPALVIQSRHEGTLI